MINKERINIVLNSWIVIVFIYVLMISRYPKFLIPMLNLPMGRVVILCCLGIFTAESALLLFVPKPGTFWEKTAVTFYFIVCVVPNILLPIIGPDYIKLGS